MNRFSHRTLLAFTAAAAPATAFGAVFTADLQPLNGSGVSGTATLTVDEDARTFRVQYEASGFDPLTLHPGHIHGLFEGGPQMSGDPPAAADSVTPTISDDTDGDGFIEVAEGLPRYGNILMPLTNVQGVANDGDANFPLSDALGNLSYDVTFDLDESNNFEDPMNPGLLLDAADIFALNLREIVLHGDTVLPGPGAGTPGEVDGTNGYLATLPVAAGEIVAVPEPASLALLLAGGARLTLRRRQRA